MSRLHNERKKGQKNGKHEVTHYDGKRKGRSSKEDCHVRWNLCQRLTSSNAGGKVDGYFSQGTRATGTGCRSRFLGNNHVQRAVSGNCFNEAKFSIKERGRKKDGSSMVKDDGKASSRSISRNGTRKIEAGKGEVRTKGKIARNKSNLLSAEYDVKIKATKEKMLSSKYAPIVDSKRMLRRRNAKENNSVEGQEKPKKRKRVIRLDPHDISNKRLDDSSTPSKVLKQKIAVSKNAQFRAIQPSPSILSVVESNLLGRRRLIELRRAGYNVKLSAPLDNIPFSSAPERERMEESVFRNKLTFFAAAKASSSFPPADLPEIAFAGRSNVGKSSLLNALTRQWGVVRTSDKPGLTQSINFFKLASQLCLVDLPGYGFAYAKEEVKDAWEELVKEYVSTRVGLKRVCLLIDAQWGMKPRDYELTDIMERSRTRYQIVLTKTDVIFPITVARRAMQVEEGLKLHNSVIHPVMMVSSQSGAGIQSLRTVLAKLARFAK